MWPFWAMFLIAAWGVLVPRRLPVAQATVVWWLVGLLFAFVWTLVARPFGAELAAKRLTRFSWRDIVTLTEPATLAEHRHMAAGEPVQGPVPQDHFRA